jgi:hypothetical protein
LGAFFYNIKQGGDCLRTNSDQGVGSQASEKPVLGIQAGNQVGNRLRGGLLA